MIASESTRRRIIRVTGVVQGVGFRPFVYRLAEKHGIAGLVRNTSGTVEIDAEGQAGAVDAFLAALGNEAPSLARVDTVTAIEADPAGWQRFEILESRAGEAAQAIIPADVSTCPDCIREIADSHDRRFGYPFTNCTNCGPRFTIVRRVPYDRANTTMSIFEMCPECGGEYRNPGDRRFHAEPTACPACGPHIWMEMDGACQPLPQPLPEPGRGACPPSVSEGVRGRFTAARLLHEGKIVAIKGLGGFHLACDARNEEAVRELRARKGRVGKPFALMVKDLAEAELLCELDDTVRDLLLSSRRPVVIARRRKGTGIAESVALRYRDLGVMLPYTPLHALLFEHAPPALVMTSANLSEEPLTFTNSSARAKLANIADAFLMHNRDIHVPCDDSVVRAIGSVMMRRSRGYVPEAIPIPVDCGPILGVGAEQKNTFCLARHGAAIPSQHIGDLDTAETFDYYRYAVDHFLSLLNCEPEVIAHDLHPEYLSTQYARSRTGARLVGVQHHHAHIAACLAENGRTEKCIGIALDGTGYGPDGTVWGGELLIADLSGFERVARLARAIMPGGEAAIRSPIRMAAAYLRAAYPEGFARISESLGLGLSPLESSALERQLSSGANSPITSSAGRLFDALSAAIGVCRERTYEGQPAIELEMAADAHENGRYLASSTDRDGILELDTLAVFRAAIDDYLAGEERAVISARFHNSLVDLIAYACEELRKRARLDTVALSGGVFQNAIILTRLRSALESQGFEVLVHKLMPPNDACISLGQAVVAANTCSGSF